MKSVIKNLLPQLCRMQKEIALSFRHFNLIWHNIPCNHSIVMNLPTGLLGGMASSSGKRFTVLFFCTNAKKNENAWIVEDLLSCGMDTTLYRY